MRFCSWKLSPLALSVVLALRASELPAQVQVISLAATAPSNLTVLVTSGAVQTMAGVADNAVNNFPAPVVIQTTWNVNPGQTNTVHLVAYFSVPSQALMGGSTQIPSSRVLGRMTTGLPVTFTPLTQNAIGASDLPAAACNSSPSTSMARTERRRAQTILISSST